MQDFVFEAEPRAQLGSRAAQRIRAQGLLPGNIYGHKEENILVSLDAKAFRRFLDDGHRILTIRIAGREERSVVKEVQYDAFGSSILHVDFTRISRDERIEMEVPVESVGVPKGLSSGGILEFPMKDLLISGIADQIPEHLEINVEALEVGDSIRVKDIAAPAGCSFVQDPEIVVLHVVAPRGEVEEVEGEAAPDQPEVIGRKHDEDEGSEKD